MSNSYKVKIAHMLDNGNKLEFEAWVDAESHDKAFDAGKSEMQKAIKSLASNSNFSIDKTKVEMGAEKH